VEFVERTPRKTRIVARGSKEGTWLQPLNNRYDELKSGRVRPIDGEEAFARLKAKTEAQRTRIA
jgi:hypothetical protein